MVNTGNCKKERKKENEAHRTLIEKTIGRCSEEMSEGILPGGRGEWKRCWKI